MPRSWRRRKVSRPARGLPALAQSWRERLDTWKRPPIRRRLAAAAQAAQAAFESVAAELTAAPPAAHRLSEEIAAAMQDLAMAGCFEVALTPCAPPRQASRRWSSVLPRMPASHCAASPRWLRRRTVAHRAGHQVITSRDSAVPTLIFDRVDVGIGGRVAEIVGKLLARLGQDRQVLCVTHLPQVAACADWQWRIAKREQGGETLSEVAPLDDAARGGGRAHARRREYHRDHPRTRGRDARPALISASSAYRPRRWRASVAMPRSARLQSFSRPRLGQFALAVGVDVERVLADREAAFSAIWFCRRSISASKNSSTLPHCMHTRWS